MVCHTLISCAVIRSQLLRSGNFGQANYSSAKMGLITFTKTLAREGAKDGIKATAICPIAASAMTETMMPPEMLAHLSVMFRSPLFLGSGLT